MRVCFEAALPLTQCAGSVPLFAIEGGNLWARNVAQIHFVDELMGCRWRKHWAEHTTQLLTELNFPRSAMNCSPREMAFC